MIKQTIYNNNAIRKQYGFCNLENPYILENTINVISSRSRNITPIYITTSSIGISGELPMEYVYQDMIRLIKKQITSNNLTIFLESIFIDKDSSYKLYDSRDMTDSNIAYEIVYAYINNCYIPSKKYMNICNNGVMLVHIPYSDGSLLTYILSVGYDPVYCSDLYYNGKEYNFNKINDRYNTLCKIVRGKLGNNRVATTHPNLDTTVVLEKINNNRLNNIDKCKEFVLEHDIHNMQLKSGYDQDLKYDKFLLNYEILNHYDNATYLMMRYHEYSPVNYNFPNKRIDYNFLNNLYTLSK